MKRNEWKLCERGFIFDVGFVRDKITVKVKNFYHVQAYYLYEIQERTEKRRYHAAYTHECPTFRNLKL